MFSSESRYFNTPTKTYNTPDGRRIPYLARRFLPRPGSLQARGQGTVQPVDRPDLAAYRTLADPLLFWRLCDINNLSRPQDLTAVPGSRFLIPRALSR